jgi:hypothetical protein
LQLTTILLFKKNTNMYMYFRNLDSRAQGVTLAARDLFVSTAGEVASGPDRPVIFEKTVGSGQLPMAKRDGSVLPLC